MPSGLDFGRLAARLHRPSVLVVLPVLALAACSDLATPDRFPTRPARASSSDALGPDSLVPREHRPIPGQYIVVFNSSVQDAPRLAEALVAGGGGELQHTYTDALRGFSAKLPDAAVDALSHNPNVESIEADALVEVEGEESPVPSWGLDRVDQAKNRLDSKYDYVSAAGTGVNVYIVDTGIRTTHSDFGGRAFEAFTTVNDGLGATDCIGHGTHVAGTVGGAAYGVAKNVRLFSVRVIPCGGSAPMSDLIAALDWIAQNRELPAVVNISLSGEYSDAANQAVAGVIATGAVVAAAAGNDFGDACLHSPGSASEALTVGASNSADMQAGYSNFGPCVDLLAPGALIKSDYFGTDTSTTVMSGTSMATPHVSGAAALYLSLNPKATPVQVASAILRTATSGVLTNLGAGSPNLLLYTGALSSWAPVPDPTPTPTPTPSDNPPTASFTASCSKAGCVFDASASTDDFGIASYAWNFGDGTPSTSSASATATHTYAAGGVYTVVLTVTDTAGHSARTSKLVRAKRS
jgi:subtilisin family serine protease